jgi:hypothetical protein
LKKIIFSLAMKGLLLYIAEYSVIYEFNKGVLTMDISKQEAQGSLDQIQAAVSQTRKRIAAGSTAPLLILWGAIWFVAYLGTYLTYLFNFEPYCLRLTHRVSIGIHIAAGLCWMVLVPIGIAASWIIGVRRAPVKSPHNKRFGFSGLILFVYAGVWLALLWPWNDYQISAFLASIPMFAYVMMGLWWADRVLLWLGIVVTLLIIVGFFLFHFQPAFWLWMAVLGGGALAGTGLYIRKAWR